MNEARSRPHHRPHGALQRLSFSYGQLLTAPDLQAAADGESRRRWLHVQAVHNTWGVALGFRLILIADQQVSVGAGLAYDCFGRELLSSRATILAPPAPVGSGVSAYYDLVIRYRDLTDRCGPWPGATACPGDGELVERPAFRWVYAGDVGSAAPPTRGPRLGEDVPLARFQVDPSGALTGPDLHVRRSARPLRRPYIASDIATPSSLAWQNLGYAWSTWIDTSAAGFSVLPYYFARLSPNPWLDDDQSVGPFFSVASPSATGFQAWLLFAGSPNADLFAQVSVFWIGVETDAGCGAMQFQRGD